MRKTLLAATAATILGAMPASAQVYFDAGPGGVGAQVGPFGFGVGPRYDRYYDPYWSGNNYYEPYRRGYYDPYWAGNSDPYWRDRRWRDGGYYRSYGQECSTVRERVVTRNGRAVYRNRQVCD